MVKEIIIDGKKIKMKSSAAVPRIYRRLFKREIFKDANRIVSQLESGEEIPDEMVETIEDLAYTFAKHASNDPNFPDIDSWLEQFGFTAMADSAWPILNVWVDDNATTSKDQDPDEKKSKGQ